MRTFVPASGTLPPLTQLRRTFRVVALGAAFLSAFAGDAEAKLLLGAHRGASWENPENTLPAFAAAKTVADYVEFDVRVTADGRLIVIHDDTVDRTTNGHGSVESRTLAELRALDAGSRFGPAFAGTRLPTLEETLTEIQTDAAPLLERKSGAVALYVELLQRVPLRSDGVVIGFSLDWLRDFKSQMPALQVGLLGSGPLDEARLTEIVRAGVGWLGWAETDLSATVVDRVHARGLHLMAWTVNEAGRMSALVAMGVDGILTDHAREFSGHVLFRSPVANQEGTPVAAMAARRDQSFTLESGAVQKERRRVTWRRTSDGQVLGRSGTLKLPGNNTSRVGQYQAEWTGPDGQVRRRSYSLAEDSDEGGFVNLSARARVASGERTAMMGWVTRGQSSGECLIRMVGPGLTAFGVTDALPRPAMRLLDVAGAAEFVADPWASTLVPAAEVAARGAFPLAAGSADVAVLRQLAPGAHMVQFLAADNQTGTGLLEVYGQPRDTATEEADLVNLSFRGWLPPGGNLAAGFVVEGRNSVQVLVRGVGPGLRPLGIVEALRDPVIKLYDARQQLIASSDDWSFDDDSGEVAAAMEQTGSAGLTPVGGRDAACRLSLPAGAYSVVMESVDPQRGGIGLIELFLVQ